ncbi:hypothetical protein LCGC14_2565910, partial [marine sediment metagenome]
MKTCKTSLGGVPACNLGSLTKWIQIVGSRASCTGLKPDLETPEHHPIMVIAKAPDMKDKLTIGAGRNIDKLKDLLALATISTEDVYVTGLVKCAPPKRNPSVQEIKACMGHLADELRAVDPEVVVIMGSDALRAFNLTGQGGVNHLHGQIIKKAFPHDDELTKEYNIVVTMDPNALYMNPDPKLHGMMVKDLRLAKSVVEGKLINPESKLTDYALITKPEDLEWMVDMIKAKGVFAFDTESRSLPWSKEPMMCMTFCWGYGKDEITAAVLPFYNHDSEGEDWKLKPTWNYGDRNYIIKILKRIFEDPHIPKIAHNIKYDMCVILKHMGIKTNGFLFDTMLMHHLLWEHPPHDLEYLSDLELNTGDYSKELHKITGSGYVLKATYDNIPDEMLWPYAVMDAENAYRLMMTYFPRLKASANLWKLYQEEVHPFIRTLFKAEWYGCRLDHT